jgi:hypothetical protein
MAMGREDGLMRRGQELVRMVGMGGIGMAGRVGGIVELG